ncbi:MAG: hypothetical protein RLZZ494_1923 [Pseudomonadota bacterium]
MPTAVRSIRLDALRGAAVLWMIGFHFCFDLNWIRLWHPVQSFTRDPFWFGQRTLIVTLFLLCVGVGQGLGGSTSARFGRRWWQIAVAAGMVSAGSALLFPRSWIAFGVLHGIAVMLLLLRWSTATLASWPAGVTLALGAGLIGLTPMLQHSAFNSPWLHWTGLMTRPPITEDFVPVLPWLGVVLWGWAWGHSAPGRRWWGAVTPPVLTPLAWLGRHSLPIYLLHQPVLIGSLWLWKAGFTTPA